MVTDYWLSAIVLASALVITPPALAEPGSGPKSDRGQGQEQARERRGDGNPHSGHPGHDYEVTDRGQVKDRTSQARADRLSSPEESRGAPLWWEERGLLTESPPLDYAVINQGQVKNLASAAAAELLENLPQGLSSEIWQMLDPWRRPAPDTNDFTAINQGQLKNVAKPFYDRLMEVGYWPPEYPWADGGTPNDYALANIGQAKNLFAFDVAFDSHDNGLPDWWEELYFGQAGLYDADDPLPGDPENENVTLLDAFREGRNPLASTDTGAGDDVGLVVFQPE